MTDSFDTMTPDEIAALTQRLEYVEGETVELPGGFAQGALIPRSVKLPPELDRACKDRAKALGRSQSAYIRELIERDIAAVRERPDTPPSLSVIAAELAHVLDDLRRIA